MKFYKVHKFKNRKKATAFQKKMKKDFGYRPALFTEVNKRNRAIAYRIIKPSGLKKIR